jgi:capsular exopolysaccharide synthesis family protein
MSRIDEALRRIETVWAPGSSEPGTITPDPKVLERYQSEGPVARKREPIPATPSRATSPPPPAVAPAPKRRSNVRSIEGMADGKLLAGNPQPLVVEQYRRLAATLHDLQIEKGLKALVVTSALPHDGKTLTAANLALTLSESYARRVLLIDADLRQPSLHKVFDVPNGAGLSEAIQSTSRALPLVEFSPSLTLMPGGRPTSNPLAALSSDRMRLLLEDVAERFDWVLLDAPPVGLLPDGLILGRLTGACVLVIRAGATPFEAVERAVAELGRESIIGTVLNGVDEGTIPSSHYDEYR